MLTRYESVDGGWGYYDFRYQANQPTSDSISFVNGAVLVAFAEAKAIGVEPPERVVKRAIAATLPATETGLQLHVRRVLEVSADA